MKLKLRKVFREPRLTNPQTKYIADICSAVAQLTLGSVVLPFVIPGLDQSKIPMIVSGIFTSIFFWLIGLRILRKVKS